MADRPGRTSDQFPLRLPDGMRSRVKEAAEANGRSMNAEIVHRLELAMSDDIWERQKFIDTLNFKQHIIDKQMHMLAQVLSEKALAQKEAELQRAMRSAEDLILKNLCLNILLHKDLPSELMSMAGETLKSIRKAQADDPTEEETNYAALRASLGDRDDVESDWEDALSDEDRSRLEESRKWSKKHE